MVIRNCYKRRVYESEIETKACDKILDTLGVFSVKLKKTGETGWPDRLFLLPGGVPLFIEFKRPGEEPDDRQLLIHARLRYFDYVVEVHDTVDGAVDAVKRRLP